MKNDLFETCDTNSCVGVKPQGERDVVKMPKLVSRTQEIPKKNGREDDNW